MAIAPACDFSDDQRNFLHSNFRVYNPDTQTTTENFSAFLGKKVVLLGNNADDPVQQYNQLDFLKQYAAGNNCLLVEGLPAHHKVQKSEITDFSSLPDTLVIEGFERRRTGAKPLYIRMMNLLHANQRAYIAYHNAESARMTAFSNFLNDLVAAGSLTTNIVNEAASTDIIDQIEQFEADLRENIEEKAAVNRTATDLGYFYEDNAAALFSEINLFASARSLLDSIKRTSAKYDRIFVIAKSHLFLGNVELYEGLKSASISVATLLPIVPEFKEVPVFLAPLRTFETVNLTFINRLKSSVSNFKIPKKFAELFKPYLHIPEPILTVTLGLHDFRSAEGENPQLRFEAGKRILLPITDYRTASEYIRTHFRANLGGCKDAEKINALFAPFDHFLFASGIGAKKLEHRIAPSNKIVIYNNRWNLCFYHPTDSNTIFLTKTITWIDTIFFFEELLKRSHVYRVPKGHELKLTDISDVDQKEVIDEPGILAEMLGIKAPLKQNVQIDGTYKVGKSGTDFKILATSDLTIRLKSTEEVSGTKRLTRSAPLDFKRIGLTEHDKDTATARLRNSNVEADFAVVENRINDLRIADSDDS